MFLSSRLPLVCAALLAVAGCTCDSQIVNKRFACASDDECAADFACRGGECRPVGGAGGGAGGPCVVGETPPRACTVGGCAQTCQADGGFGQCQPSVGPGFDSNPLHCGACGRTCQGGQGTCVAMHCACSLDADCPPGEVCGQGGLCVAFEDPCSGVRCTAGTVCRAGTCVATDCTAGCRLGEVCDADAGACRPLDACRLPTACGDGGICEGGPRADGTVCSDGQDCTHSDVCAAGACQGQQYTCTPGICASTSVCAGDGGCVTTPRNDGATCDDQADCTFGDQCVSGTCRGTAYTCTPGVCASTSVCAGDGGCLTTPRNDGASCDDGVACSHTDVCNVGNCVGVSYACPLPTECEVAVACSGDGGCVSTPKTAGAACDDGQACTGSDTCNASGVCGGQPTTTYRDLDGDGIGDSNVSQNACPAGAGWVQQGGDCNDTDPDVYRNVANLVTDGDRDGHATSSAGASQCVGDTLSAGGRTYYRDLAGTYSWLDAAAVLGTSDCLDTDGNVYRNVTVGTDADQDGHTTAAQAVQCVGASTTVSGRTYYANSSAAFTWLGGTPLGTADCADNDLDIFRTVTVSTDVDQDGYAVGSPAPQCVGASTTVSTRTYYANATGGFSWLGGTPLGNDCNDANATIQGAFPWYLDADSDTYGGTTTQTSCASPGAGYVTVSGDCNDADADVYRTGLSVVPDLDRDGYKTGGSAASTSVCVGVSTTLGGRTYYRADTGADTWLATPSSLGDDCDDADVDVFRNVSVATDVDQDGHSVGGSATQCVGATVAVGGRTYYANASGLYVWLGGTPLGTAECDDADADIFRTVTVSTDMDQDGYAVGSPGSQCVGASSAVGGRTYYASASGTFTWLGSASLGNDCNDANAAVYGPFPWYLDSDGDGYGGATSQVSCTQPAAGYVVSGNECDDANLNIYRNLSVSTDADQDGYSVGGASTQCVGASTTVALRTYYRNASGSFTWLGGTPLGSDCDDGSAAVLGPRSWYNDIDGDGYGSGAATIACTAPVGYVANNTDCLDNLAGGGPYVYRNVASLYDDTDRDGYVDSAFAAATRCVGLSNSTGGRTYYRSTTGLYTWTQSSYGTDCLDSDADVYQVQNNMLTDFDNDGYPVNDNAFSVCAGALTTIGGRSYYYGTSGTPDYLLKTDCIGRQGNNCPDLDCYDSNANARPFQTAYFTTSRGDGSFDYNCNGLITRTATTYCSSQGASSAWYSDTGCTAGTGTFNLCNATAAVSTVAPGTGCGQPTTTTGYYFNAVPACVPATRTTATLVGCY